ncbi:rRNA maturation RNase YbeY [Draconibacterium sp. IB214405]|uniref:rRNA maturation RNase YbeY n=1 Tax=Draconibacterium sp. IB214405 TaxID=3097352 RepID=UPI002A155DB4|nr:rRNA maturation RNase YbeY [Draconibacterium sp. IB214405]MDX8337810.1 rRNA maturation RNase YbeY [Draconibacterium sp. IB214405]
MSNIEFFFEDIEPISIYQDFLVTQINGLISNEKFETGEINVIFCSDDYLLEMNKQYLDHDYYTDIITFDYVDNDVISGDLFISVDRINENADSFKTLQIKELYRVVLHGVLHLVGYKDKTDEDQEEMTKMEEFYLAKIDFKELKV